MLLADGSIRGQLDLCDCHDASELGHVEGWLRHAVGVEDAKVDRTRSVATIRIDPNRTALEALAAGLEVVHELLAAHDKIKRTVTPLSNGTRTVTESDDPRVAKENGHAASMAGRLKDGRVFNVASHTLPTIFANNDKVRTRSRADPQGDNWSRTSTEPATVTALKSARG